MAPIPTTTADTRAAPKSAARLLVALLLGLTVTGCSAWNAVNDTLFGNGGPKQGQQGFVKGFLGEVVADEPRAALAGREILSAGGNAADAAVAVALSLTVTLPSRAGLGGGGACIAYTADKNGLTKGMPEAIMFVAPSARSIGGGDRPAAVPLTARGIYLLHARQGRLPFDTLITKAEQLAHAGVPVSRALARDLALVYGPLSADPAARAIFGTRDGPLAEGQGLVQPQLASTLAQLRVAGVGDLYLGQLAHRIEETSPAAGVPIGLADLRVAFPSFVAPVIVPFGNDQVAFPPTDGGLGAAAALMALKSQPDDLQGAFSRSLAAAARWRAGGENADQVLNGPMTALASTPLYPASTSFATLDSEGNAVMCALTMNNLFGTGRIIPGLGFLAAASPATVNSPLLAPGLVWSMKEHAFRAGVGTSGQAGASLAAAVALSNTLRYRQPMTALVPEPGRANVIACPDYLPGSDKGCSAVADPREFGFATGGN